MIATKDLIEFIYAIDTGDNPRKPEDAEKINMIVHRLKDYDNFTQQLDYLHTEVMAGRQFENGE